jgi:hypothetical protein
MDCELGACWYRFIVAVKECGAAAAVAVSKRRFIEAVVNELVGESLTARLTLTSVILCHLVVSNSL